MSLVKDFFIGLSNNTFLNNSAKKYGPVLGASKVVVGNSLDDLIKTIRELNDKGITVTVDCLGEFVGTEEESLIEKNIILKVLQAMHDNDVKAHLSIKISQLGAEFDLDLAERNLREIVAKAKELDNRHVNIDTEKFEGLDDILHVLDDISKEYDNVGTVIQAYLYTATDMVEKYPHIRLRLVKGAYKENASIAYQNKEDIDANYISLIEKRLKNAKNFTSIATHDDKIIDHVKKFVEENNINRDDFEFQMLFGFRTDLAYATADENYNFCIYVPFGDDWFGYFMRRLAERPQNLNLAVKEFVKPKSLAITAGVIAAVIGVTTAATALIKKNK
ncbi:proline dehydrogenase [Staphylococcus condimenti]|uniref:proline dehydrogenase n=1 Tax=Staphylococcus condimenti TaxID=70255 RepID=A0A143P8S5_9STAP|nr:MULTISPECIES: proline dehydrogenase family protein [Staphylococcus]AMY04508.1 proline dehydrogenase [Staphylococcus condimenti]APR60745.1 proline dehydrogenase [Staphylococcus condimenti]MDK8644812.1 proline dehydrogenase family protein [Staphylococcus condimenti]OFO98888.1 proline dehydrogenase [Staphylococcus sp. HMSC065E08]PNZ57248.1 proline dehydrogenase [Staphylococcus condimenti]